MKIYRDLYEKLSDITSTRYDIIDKPNCKDFIVCPKWEDVNGMIEDLIDEVENLKEKIKELEDY